MVKEPLSEKVADIRAIYKNVDEAAAGFQRACGFECVKDCGHCCENARIETTELALLPLAVVLIAEGKAEDLYACAEKKDFKGCCIFFQPEIAPGAGGHCGVYEHRPLICRLFGSSGNKEKHGAMRLVVCGPIKQSQPQAFKRAEAAILAGTLKAPDMAEHAMRLMSVDPGLSCESLPINKAFKRAVERVMLLQRWQAAHLE